MSAGGDPPENMKRGGNTVSAPLCCLRQIYASEKSVSIAVCSR